MRIFISYARDDSARASGLGADLLELGHQVWLDRQLTGGQAWWDQILQRIRDCEAFVVALSPRALESTACDREWRYASALGKGLLPVLIDGEVSADLLPPQLAAIQYVDYRDQGKQAALRLMRAIDNAAPAGPMPSPLPPPPEVPLSYLGGLRERIHSQPPMSFPDQSALVIQLRHALREQGRHGEIDGLIRHMLNRDDLLARVAEELRQLLAMPEGPVANTAVGAAAAASVTAGLAASAVESLPALAPRPRYRLAMGVVVAGAVAVLLLVAIVVGRDQAPSANPGVGPVPVATLPQPEAAASGTADARKQQITQDIEQLLKAAR